VNSTLSSRDQCLVERIIPNLPEHGENMVDEAVKKLRDEATSWITGLVKLEAKLTQTSEKILKIKKQSGLLGFLHRLMTLRWLQWMAARNEIRRKELKQLIQEREHLIQDLVTSPEARGKLLDELIKSRLLTFRQSLLHNMEEIFGVEHFGFQTAYGFYLSVDDHRFHRLRERHKEYSLRVCSTLMRAEGYAFVITCYEDKVYREDSYDRQRRRRIYNVHIVDTDEKRKVWEVEGSEGDGYPCITVQEDNPNEIRFTLRNNWNSKSYVYKKRTNKTW